MVKFLTEQDVQVSNVQTKLIKKASLNRQADFVIQEKKQMERDLSQKHKQMVFGVYNKKTDTFYYIDFQQYLSLKKHLKRIKKPTSKELENEETVSAPHADQRSESKMSNLMTECSQLN